MAAISSHGRTVIIVTWTFTGLTFISLTTYVVYLYLHPGMRFRPSDFIVFIAFLIGLALCGQITWAIVIEGWRYRQADFTSRQIHVIAQVNNWVVTPRCILLRFVLVASHKRDSLDSFQCFGEGSQWNLSPQDLRSSLLVTPFDTHHDCSGSTAHGRVHT